MESPAIRKLLQAAGRVVRSETDKGLIIITDNRTIKFSDHIPELEVTDNIIHDIQDFFEA